MEQLAQYSEGFRKGSPITCGTSIMKKISSRSYILGPNGKLTGFELDRDRGQFDRKGYLDGYTVTSAFLFWLEVRKDKSIVPALNKALRDEQYSAEIF